MNRYLGTGRLTRDPELRQMGSTDGQVCEMRVAFDNGRDRKATFLDLKAYNDQGRACARYLAKGSRIAVDGRLDIEEWETDGQKRRRPVVKGWVEFLDPKPQDGDDASSSENGASAGATEPVAAGSGSDDDIPF